MGKGFKGAAEENRSRRREGLKHRTTRAGALSGAGRGGVATMTLLPLLLTFTFCFLLHLWANLNLAILLVTGRADHGYGPQGPPSPLELYPQRHQGGPLRRPHLAQVNTRTGGWFHG